MECKAINPAGRHVFEASWDIDDEDNDGQPCGCGPNDPIHDMYSDQEAS